LLAAAAAATTDMGWNFVAELQKLKEAFNSGGVEASRAWLERKRDEWKQIPLKVAVIGRPGVGKSSFINAIRRMYADDEGGAPVGNKETTVDVDRSYPHPNNPLLKFWDLPGVGTNRFRRETYLSDIKVDRFDFFLLITADRFTQDDTWLGGEFDKRNKKYFFVRTKVGADIANNKKAHRKTQEKDDVVRDIRESTQKQLKENGCEHVPVFLIDSYELNKFDFDLLERRLIEDFPEMKKAALVLTLQATSKEMINHKVAELRSRMWKLAALSGAVGAIPVPGVSMVMDISIVAAESGFYFTQLGLDETSLKRYAEFTNTDYQSLSSIVVRIFGDLGIRAFVETFIKTGTLVAAAAAEEGLKLLPVIGSLIGALIGAPLSFAGTYCTLKLVLDKMERVALEVAECVAESAANADDDDEP